MRYLLLHTLLAHYVAKEWPLNLAALVECNVLTIILNFVIIASETDLGERSYEYDCGVYVQSSTVVLHPLQVKSSICRTLFSSAHFTELYTKGGHYQYCGLW